jgi:hypothetical protein
VHAERGLGWGKQQLLFVLIYGVGWHQWHAEYALQGAEQFVRHTGKHVGMYYIQQHEPKEQRPMHRRSILLVRIFKITGY